jgi:uncharacterized OsmC-like protein
MNNSTVIKNQTPLRALYLNSPSNAQVVDRAKTVNTNPSDPFHAKVHPMPGIGAELPVGVHQAVGGLHDAPTPGDILCAALAACQDSTIRMIANILGIELEYLEVEVSADVDVRGTMMIDYQVPVGFQSLRCKVHLNTKPGTNKKLIEKLKIVSQQCCVVQQTLNSPPPIDTTFETAVA